MGAQHRLWTALSVGGLIIVAGLGTTRGQVPEPAATTANSSQGNEGRLESPSNRPTNAREATNPGQSQRLSDLPDHIRPQARSTQQRRSIVHHYPYPYPSYYHGEETAGFRNPNGVGRYYEYYPPGNQFQFNQDPTRPAQFDTVGAINRQEQLQATQIGIQRYNSIQNHIDRYARPYWGYGFGAGMYGGFW
jgi:hypothetical protein